MVRNNDSLKWLNIIGRGYNTYKKSDAFHQHPYTFAEYFFGFYNAIPEMKNDRFFFKI